MHARVLTCLLSLTTVFLPPGQVPSARAAYGENVIRLPAALDELQNDLTKDYDCAPDWSKSFADEGGWRWSVDPYTHFWVLPCSRGDAHNPSRKLWVEFGESPPLYRRVKLPLIDPDLKRVARDEIYDFSWNKTTDELTSVYRIHGRPDCGSKMVYHWDASTEQMELRHAFVKPTCDGRPEEWPEVPR